MFTLKGKLLRTLYLKDIHIVAFWSYVMHVIESRDPLTHVHIFEKRDIVIEVLVLCANEEYIPPSEIQRRAQEK